MLQRLRNEDFQMLVSREEQRFACPFVGFVVSIQREQEPRDGAKGIDDHAHRVEFATLLERLRLVLQCQSRIAGVKLEPCEIVHERHCGAARRTDCFIVLEGFGNECARRDNVTV
jgi:hypothetical protein